MSILHTAASILGCFSDDCSELSVTEIVGRLGMRPGLFAALRLVSGALLTVCLPIPDLFHRQGNVRIEALGTRGPQAKST